MFQTSFFFKVDSAWIAYNKPKSPELANEYAGFLMALGLNGHLTKLATLNIHDYLTKVQKSKHSLDLYTAHILSQWAMSIVFFVTTLFFFKLHPTPNRNTQNYRYNELHFI